MTYKKYKKKYPVWIREISYGLHGEVSIAVHREAFITVHHSVKESFEKNSGVKMQKMKFDRKAYNSLKEKGTVILQYGMLPKIEMPQVEIKKDDIKVLNYYGFKVIQPTFVGVFVS